MPTHSRPLFLTGCTQPQQDGDVGTGFEAVEDACDPPCIAHKVFGLSLMEMTECGACGSNSEPFLYTKFMHYVSSVALIQYGGSLIVFLSYWGGVFVCCWEARFKLGVIVVGSRVSYGVLVGRGGPLRRC